MSDVFISYSRRDIAFTRLIRASLQQSQIDTWIDWERIPVGEKWWPEICEAIQDFQALVDWCQQNGCADTAGVQRAAWITALKQGQNPFDAQTLQSLRNP